MFSRQTELLLNVMPSKAKESYSREISNQLESTHDSSNLCKGWLINLESVKNPSYQQLVITYIHSSYDRLLDISQNSLVIFFNNPVGMAEGLKEHFASGHTLQGVALNIPTQYIILVVSVWNLAFNCWDVLISGSKNWDAVTILHTRTMHGLPFSNSYSLIHHYGPSTFAK